MSVAIVFDTDWEEGPGEAFQSIVEDMKGLLVEVTPADGSPMFLAVLMGGHNPDDHLEEEWLDELHVQRVDVDLEPVGKPEYVRVKTLKLSA